MNDLYYSKSLIIKPINYYIIIQNLKIHLKFKVLFKIKVKKYILRTMGYSSIIGQDNSD